MAGTVHLTLPASHGIRGCALETVRGSQPLGCADAQQSGPTKNEQLIYQHSSAEMIYLLIGYAQMSSVG